jgi:hypothetical protein
MKTANVYEPPPVGERQQPGRLRQCANTTTRSTNWRQAIRDGLRADERMAHRRAYWLCDDGPCEAAVTSGYLHVTMS